MTGSPERLPQRVSFDDKMSPESVQLFWKRMVSPVARKLNFREEPTRDVQLFWRRADDLTIRSTHALYLIRRFGTRSILYIGKADRQSFKARWNCRSKNRWRPLERKGVRLAPLVAGLFTSRVVTPKLIQDVERLLIFLVQPALNEKGKLSCALHHRELRVTCTGEWPYPRGVFSYCDNLPHSLEISCPFGKAA
jgi:hypothetical protein